MNRNRPQAGKPALLVAVVVLAALAAEPAGGDAPGGDWILQSEAVARLTEHGGPQAVAQLEAWLDAPSLSPWLRGRCLVGLARLRGEAAADRVQSWAAADQPVLREAAAEALPFTHKHRAIPLLDKLLQDADPGVRLQAAEGLVRIEGPGAWQRVEPRLGEPTPATLLRHARVLAMVNHPAARERLRRLFDAASASERVALVGEIGRHRQPWVAQWLAELAAGEDETTRAAAETALVGCETGAVAAPLVQLLKAQEPEKLRRAVALACRHPSKPVADAVADLLRRGGSDVELLGEELTAAALQLLLEHPAAEYLDVFGSYSTSGSTRDNSWESGPVFRLRQACLEGIALTAADDRAMFEAIKPAVDDGRMIEQAAQLLWQHTTSRPERGWIAYFAEALKKDPQHAVAPAIHLGVRMNSEEVDYFVEFLLAAAKNLPQDTSHYERATHRLRRAARRLAGYEAWRLAESKGYVAHWMIIGPFDNDLHNSGFRAVFPPEREIDFTKTYRGGEHRHRSLDPLRSRFLERNLREAGLKNLHKLLDQDPQAAWAARLRSDERLDARWMACRTGGDGVVHFDWYFIGPHVFRVGYAVAEFTSPEEQAVTLSVELDNGGMVWLDGRKLGEIGADEDYRTRDVPNESREIEFDGDDVGVTIYRTRNELTFKETLAPGRHRLVLKATNLRDDWWARCRIMRDGEPAKLEFWRPAGTGASPGPVVGGGG